MTAAGTAQRARVGDVLGERGFRIGDVLGAAGFVRALGESDGPIARLRDALDAGHHGRLASPAMLGFFQVCGFDEFVARLGVDPARTMFAGAAGTVDGVPLYEDDDVVGRTVLTKDDGRDLPDGRRMRQIAIETVFSTGAGAPISAVTFSFLEMSMSHQHRTPELDRFGLARLAVATDDPNPVHHDHSQAVAAGLPGVIGSGLFVLGLLDKAVRDTAGVEAGYSFEVRMRAPILPDAALEITWDDADGSVTVGSAAADGAGASIATGSLRLTGSGDG